MSEFVIKESKMDAYQREKIDTKKETKNFFHNLSSLSSPLKKSTIFLNLDVD